MTGIGLIGDAADWAAGKSGADERLFDLVWNRQDVGLIAVKETHLHPGFVTGFLAVHPGRALVIDQEINDIAVGELVDRAFVALKIIGDSGRHLEGRQHSLGGVLPFAQSIIPFAFRTARSAAAICFLLSSKAGRMNGSGNSGLWPSPYSW